LHTKPTFVVRFCYWLRGIENGGDVAGLQEAIAPSGIDCYLALSGCQLPSRAVVIAKTTVGAAENRCV
jgi:hypothetical protein